MNKKAKIAVISLCVLAALAAVILLAVNFCKSDEPIDENKLNINEKKISDVYILDGATDERYELTDEEKNTVISGLNMLSFAESGDMPTYHMCVIVATESVKQFILKYTERENCLYITDGAEKTGYYTGGSEIKHILKKYESEYGHGTIVDYSEIANKLQSEAEAALSASSE